MFYYLSFFLIWFIVCVCLDGDKDKELDKMESSLSFLSERVLDGI